MVERKVRAYVSFEGRYAGTVGPIAVAEPWWNEARTATAALDDVIKARTAIVRLLEVSPDSDHGPRGGEASYHVEALTPPSGLDERPADEWAAIMDTLLEDQPGMARGKKWRPIGTVCDVE